MVYKHKPKKITILERALLRIPFIREKVVNDGICTLRYKEMFGNVYLTNIELNNNNQK